MYLSQNTVALSSLHLLCFHKRNFWHMRLTRDGNEYVHESSSECFFPCSSAHWFLSRSFNCLLPPSRKCQVLLAGTTTASSLSRLSLASPLCNFVFRLSRAGNNPPYALPLCFLIFPFAGSLVFIRTPLTWHTETRESSDFIQAGGIILAWVGMAFVDVHFTARSCVALQTLTVERTFCVYAFPTMFTWIAVCCKKNTHIWVSKPLLAAGKPQHSLLVMVFSSGHSFPASNTKERLVILLGKGYCDWRKHVALNCLSESKRKIAIITDGPKEQL